MTNVLHLSQSRFPRSMRIVSVHITQWCFIIQHWQNWTANGYIMEDCETSSQKHNGQCHLWPQLQAEVKQTLQRREQGNICHSVRQFHDECLVVGSCSLVQSIECIHAISFQYLVSPFMILSEMSLCWFSTRERENCWFPMSNKKAPGSFFNMCFNEGSCKEFKLCHISV